MADAVERPEDGAEADPPTARKAAAGKAPAGKAPARKTPAKKAAAKRAPAKKAPAKKAPAKKAPPALEAAPPQGALTSGVSAARQAAANAKSSVQDVDNPVAPRPARDGADYRLPMSLALAAAGLVALVLSRFRRD